MTDESRLLYAHSLLEELLELAADFGAFDLDHTDEQAQDIRAQVLAELER